MGRRVLAVVGAGGTVATDGDIFANDLALLPLLVFGYDFREVDLFGAFLVDTSVGRVLGFLLVKQVYLVHRNKNINQCKQPVMQIPIDRI